MKTPLSAHDELIHQLEARVVQLEQSNRELELGITENQRTQDLLIASETRYRRLFETAKDGILILDAVTGMVVDVNPFLIELLGYSREEFLDKKIWELGFFRDIVANHVSFMELQEKDYIRYEDKPLKNSVGQRIDVEFVSNVYLVNHRRVIQCNIRDITKRKQTEAALLASLHEKVALLNEVHHRVKNNLQVIMSLLRMETRKNLEPVTKGVLNEMQGRIRSMAVLHEMIYRTGQFARVNLAEYLRQLTAQLFKAQTVQTGAVRLALELDSMELDIDQAIPCGLIVNELVTNSLKHGFPGSRLGEVRITLRREADGPVRLQVSDTGIGLPDGFDSHKATSLGLHLVEDLARQLQGTLTFGPGATYTLVFMSGSAAKHRVLVGEVAV